MIMFGFKITFFHLWQSVLAAPVFHGKYGRFLIALLPLGWVVLFFVFPFANVFKISFSESVFAAPPYVPLI